MRTELRERLAELEHEQWSYWADSIIATEPISNKRKDRWVSYMIPYPELSEELKEHDRVWADKVLAIMDDYYNPGDRERLE
jgi:hypothetical protein